MKNLKSIIENYGINYELTKNWSIEPINEDAGALMKDDGPAKHVSDPNAIAVNKNTDMANSFIRSLDDQTKGRIKSAILTLSMKYVPHEDTTDGRFEYYKIKGQNMKLHFEPMSNGDVKSTRAVFQFVENTNRAKDLAFEFKQATTDYVGTDEDTLFAVPAALRAYTNKINIRFADEMQALNKEVLALTKKTVLQIAASEIEEAQDRNCLTLLYAAFWADENGEYGTEGAGLNYATSIITNGGLKVSDTQSVAGAIETTSSHLDIQKLMLSCSYDYVRKINAEFSKKKVDLFKTITADVKGDIKLAFKYYFMGAGILPRDATFTKLYDIISNGTGNKKFIEL